MKKAAQILGGLFLSLGAGSAFAQSQPITFYGVLDLNLRRVEAAGASLSKVEPDGSMGSRLGVRGERSIDEDLAGGFTLESALKPDTGVAGSTTALFSRRATLSLVSKTYGELRMGRDTTPSWNNLVVYDHFQTGLASLTKLLVPAGVNASEIFGRRLDNTVSYFLPKGIGGFSGLQGQLQVAAGEGAVSGKSQGARLAYVVKDYSFGVAHTQVNVAGGKWSQDHVGAHYDFGVAKLLLQFASSKTTAGSGAKEDLWELGAVLPAGPDGQVKLGYAKASGYASASKITGGYLHTLSKDVLLYTHYTQIRNQSSRAAFTVESGPATVAGKQQTATGYEVGIRYVF